MLTNEQIRQACKEAEDYVIACRRRFHREPELTGEEYKTSAFIKSEIEAAGLPYESLPGTGVIAVLDTGRPGKHVALRADIDALPVQESEENLAGPRVCRSEVPGVFHACGHDAHAAMLLGAMKALIRLRDGLRGKVFFCFEEGEEHWTGISNMLDGLKDKRIDTVWGLHVYAGLDSGKISVDAGPRMAGSFVIQMTMRGKGGHGSRPDQAVDPLIPAAMVVPAWNCAFKNQLNVEKPVTLAITSIQGGVTTNVIPNTATILGSVRFFHQEEGIKARSVILDVAEHVARMNLCTLEVGPRMLAAPSPDAPGVAPAVVNDEKASALAARALEEILPQGSVTTCPKWYASESFSLYTMRYPSVFAFLGIRNLECGAGAEHHNEKFDLDEKALPVGVLATVKYVDAVVNGEE